MPLDHCPARRCFDGAVRAGAGARARVRCGLSAGVGAGPYGRLPKLIYEKDTFDGRARHELAAGLLVGNRSAGLAPRPHASLF